MQLEFRRLFASDTWVLGSAAERVAALHLWCESWHQLPAASLPNDDRMLAHLSGAGTQWRKIKDHALRGWIACRDGRLYHPVVAQKAMQAWESKMEMSRRGKAGAAKKHGTGNAQATLFSSTSTATGSTSMPREVKGSEVKGSGKDKNPFVLPDWIDPAVWNGFVEMRVKIRHPMTERAKELIVAELVGLRELGQDANAILNRSVSMSWRGVFALKSSGSVSTSGSSQSETARRWAEGGKP